MNVQIKPQGVTRPLLGRVALVTGSTSGIGLGIARALAQAGCAIVLNGFGEPACFSQAMPAPRLPARRCRSTAAGPRIDSFLDE